VHHCCLECAMKMLSSIPEPLLSDDSYFLSWSLVVLSAHTAQLPPSIGCLVADPYSQPSSLPLVLPLLAHTQLLPQQHVRGRPYPHPAWYCRWMYRLGAPLYCLRPSLGPPPSFPRGQALSPTQWGLGRCRLGEGEGHTVLMCW
jgi:hypothetical protein